MRKILLLLAILLVITACGKEEVAENPSVVQPAVPVCGNGILEQGEQCDPPGEACSQYCQRMAPPVQPPVNNQPPVVNPPPVVTPPPVVQPTVDSSLLPKCKILKKEGHVYTEANIGPAYVPGVQITNAQSEDLSVCYPYFEGAAATSSGVCCLI